MGEMVLVFLQNAYRKNGRRFHSREFYLKRLWLSHTGRRLSQMMPDGVEPYVENASPRIGLVASDAFRADTEHMGRIIAALKPDCILACGRIAQAGLDELGVAYIPAPHPAWRGLSTGVIKGIRASLQERLAGDGKQVRCVKAEYKRVPKGKARREACQHLRCISGP